MNSLVGPAQDILLDPVVLASAAASSALLLSGAAARVIEITAGRRTQGGRRSAR